MTLCFDGEQVAEHLSSELALNAMEECFAAEARGVTSVPPRIDTDSSKGFIRAMPAVFDDVMGLKVMTLVEGLGTRYVVLLFDVANGELLAIFDAEELTRARTAATTALAARHMCRSLTHLGIIGTGFEAVGHLRLLADLWPLQHVAAYSPNAERREEFAHRMSSELGIEVVPVDRPEKAMAGHPCVVLATKAKTPVVDGAAFDAKTVVLSIGATRLDLRELDGRSFARAATVVVDNANQMLHECGDVADSIAGGVFSADRMTSLAQLVAGATLAPLTPERDLHVFKSVGTALQDLALARALYRDEGFRARGIDIGEVASLKPFSARAVIPRSVSA
jgi:alanine dehydrogenase